MKAVKNLIIGFGKGGKTLAGALSSAGESVLLVEASDKMFGGTCINVACIPSKSMEFSARHGKDQGGDYEEKAARYKKAVEEKNNLTAALRSKNYDKVIGAGAQVIVGTASFVDSTHVLIKLQDGSKETVQADRIFINTGARPFIPPIAGLKESHYAYTSEQLLSLEKLPRHLVIIGGGYIGLEFASFFRNFGSEVTIIQDSDAFIPREDEEISAAVLSSLEDRGITVLRNAKTQKVEDNSDGENATLTLDTPDGMKQLNADAILVATGRRPNVQGLNLEAAGVELTERGAVRTDEHLQTTAPNIWAMGDVVGGLQFTYISLDDFRIVRSELLGDGSRTTKNRGEVPYSVFLDPPFSRVGMSEAEAEKAGHNVKIAKLPAMAIPKAKVLRQPTGLLKAIIDADTGLILGAHLFCADSHEMINTVKIAMDAKLPYTVLRDAIYTHPTMSEAFNDLFAAVK